MKKYSQINIKVYAEPGSRLELAVVSLLKGAGTHRKAIRENFKKRKEKQLRKIERGRL